MRPFHLRGLESPAAPFHLRCACDVQPHEIRKRGRTADKGIEGKCLLTRPGLRARSPVMHA